MLDQGRHWLNAAAEAARVSVTGLTLSTDLRDCVVADVLIRESETASMIAIDTRGLSALTGLLVGCSSVAFAGQADCPVVIVRDAGPDRPPRDTGPPIAQLVVVGRPSAASYSARRART